MAHLRFSGDFTQEATLVPIPNTTVKLPGPMIVPTSAKVGYCRNHSKSLRFERIAGFLFRVVISLRGLRLFARPAAALQSPVMPAAQPQICVNCVRLCLKSPVCPESRRVAQ